MKLSMTFPVVLFSMLLACDSDTQQRPAPVETSIDAAGDLSENSVSITRITPDPTTALTIGRTVTFEVEIAYTLSDDSGDLNLVLQRAERDGIEAHLGGTRHVVSKGAGSVTLKKSIVVPDTQTVYLFTPLAASQSTSTTTVDSRSYKVER